MVMAWHNDGTNFANGSVRWNGSGRTTTYVSSTQLTASITAPDIAVEGTASVTVFNPAPGGGVSNAASFSVGNLGPTPGFWQQPEGGAQIPGWTSGACDILRV